MTLDEIKRRVDEIEASVWDDERAHSLEDRILLDFVQHVAANAPEPIASMASEVLRTTDLDFSRWTA